MTRRKGLFHYVTSGSNVARHAEEGSRVQSRVQLYYRRLSADSLRGNTANQIHGFTADYGKFILISISKFLAHDNDFPAF